MQAEGDVDPDVIRPIGNYFENRNPWSAVSIEDKVEARVMGRIQFESFQSEHYDLQSRHRTKNGGQARSSDQERPGTLPKERDALR